MRYVYGPLKSRRLGLSLGISLSASKVCNFDCVYCQLGKTAGTDIDRQEYARAQDILDELKVYLEQNPEEAAKLDYVTISGAGEPTLNSAVGPLVSKIKEICGKKIALITNASLMKDLALRRQLLALDLVIPSLDAGTDGIFQRINRPSKGILLEAIIQGLVDFRKEFRGQVWLEVMLVAGLNDDLRHIKKLKEVIDKISPDKVQLNSPLRSTAEEDIAPVEKKKLEKIRQILGGNVEII